MNVDATIQQTPLSDRHAQLGARLIEFGGWLMPVQYGGILEEHKAVRERAGLFDLSHMGELFVERRPVDGRFEGVGHGGLLRGSARGAGRRAARSPR